MSDSSDHGDGTSLDLQGLAPGRPLEVDDVERSETFIDTFDDEKLFCQSWQPADGTPQRGAVALMHGYGEHSSRYDHVAAGLVRAGWGVMAIDARGHGRSTGKRAHVQRYGDYVRDYSHLVARIDRVWPDLPIFSLGHSNGGLIVLRYALTAPDEIDGFVVTSPMCGLAVDVPVPKAAAGRLMSRVWPSFSMPNDIDAAHLTHDTTVVERYRRDPLVLEVATARWFTEAMAAQEDLLGRADTLQDPFLFLVAGDDRLCDPGATREVFHRMTGPDRELEVFPDLYHEVLNEAIWDDLLVRIVEWLDQQGGGDGRQEAA